MSRRWASILAAVLLIGEPAAAFSLSARQFPYTHKCIPAASSVVACAQPSKDTVVTEPAAAEKLDPKDALAELPKLMEQIQVLWTEGKTWGAEERAERRRSIVNSYVRVFAPALALSGVQLGLSLGSFALVLLVLNVSGLGYAQIVDLVADVPLIGGAVSSIDPSWGNAAISLAVVEVINVPLLLPLAATATPAATDALSAKLTEWGFDAEGLNAKIEAVLEKTS